jgi:hypothetical protein
MRIPAAVISTRQSFDITEQLRHRKLPEASIATVAIAFARMVICWLQPTLSIDRMRLFISHRRFDGEDLAAAFYEQLKVRAEETFRDLIDVRVGENAQEIIESNLTQSDAVILLDTPRAGESEWIAREIEMAMVLGLPIVWIRIGPAPPERKLKIPPAASPHFDLPQLSASEFNAQSTLVDDVLRATFRVSRQAASRVFDQIRRVEAIALRKGVKLEKVDARKMLYSLQIPRKGFRYPQRPLAHLVQFYGRWPKETDESDFVELARQSGYSADPKHGPVYDTGLLLGPIPAQSLADHQVRPYVDSSEEYMGTLEKYLQESEPTIAKRGLIISGAFPDAEPEEQQHLTDAIMAFTRAMLDRQCLIIFGGHPTFTPLILDMSRRRRPKDFKEAVHLYQSRLFVTDQDLQRLQKQATVFGIDAVAADRTASLTKMRQQMINDSQAAGLVAIGGRTKTEVHSPGIDEEIQLAAQAGIPVFLVGSAGGRTAEICAEYKAINWQNVPNKLSAAENEELMTSLDYGVLADKVLAILGL